MRSSADRRGVLEPGPLLELGGEPGAEMREASRGWRRRGERGQRVDAEPAQALGGLRTDARHEPARRRSEPLAGLLAAQHDEPARLLGVGGDLGHELVRSDADRAAEAGGLLDPRRQAAHRGVRGRQAAQVEVGLVQADDLDHVDGGPHDRHHLARGLAVVGEVGREEHALRAQPPRPRGRHGRADAEPPRLVGGRGHDRARSGAGDDHRPAPELGPAAQLDRDVERVHVEVRDAAVRHRAARLGHVPDVRSGQADRRPTQTIRLTATGSTRRCRRHRTRARRRWSGSGPSHARRRTVRGRPLSRSPSARCSGERPWFRTGACGWPRRSGRESRRRCCRRRCTRRRRPRGRP